jgi:hypothetical protein
MKFMQLIVAAVISLTAVVSHAAFTSNPAMTEAQVRAEIVSQLAAQTPPGSNLEAVAQNAADAGVDMTVFVRAAMDIPGITPAQAVYAAVKAQPSRAAAIAEAAARKDPNSSIKIASAAARAAPESADAIADAVAAVKPEWAWGIYAAVLNAVPTASLTWLNSQTFCLVASANCQTPTASPN